MKFYTNISVIKNKICVSGYEDGKRVRFKVPYKPYLFVPDKNKTSKYVTLKGDPVSKVDFDSINEARDFMKEYKDVDGFPIYGMNKFLYTYIYDTYKTNREIEYDASLVSVGFIDIETAMGIGFPNIQLAENEVTLISIDKDDHTWTYGCKPYENSNPKVTYTQCHSEIDLLQKFLRKWEELDLDVITGWNIAFFDIPYLVNRIKKLMGAEEAKRLSPWGVLRERMVEIQGKEQQTYEPDGVAVLDYLESYKKFGYTQQENYTLDHVAFEEVGERKLEFDGSLADLEKDWQLYTEYNIKDVDLVKKIDAKRKILLLIMAMAYDAGVTYRDTFGTVLIWDILIHNHLMDRNIVIPQFKHQAFTGIMGGKVKESQVGMHGWSVSLDLTSLYPSLIIMYNISPETMIGMAPFKVDVDLLLDNKLSLEDRQYLVDNNYSLAANGVMFDRSVEGFLPAIMQRLFDKRVLTKRVLKDKERELEAVKGTTDTTALSFNIVELDSSQTAIKLELNGGYGALANEYNRWFSSYLAEAITASGQLTIQFIQNKINEYFNRALKSDNIDYITLSDTDSCFINVDEIVKRSKYTTKPDIVNFIEKMCKEALLPYINKQFDVLMDYMNARKQTMDMKIENIGNKTIVVAKKRYIMNVYYKEGVRYDKPKLKMVGIEAIRTSTPRVARDAIKQSLDIIMNQDETDFQRYVGKFKSEFMNMSFEQIACPRSVNELDKWRDSASIYKKGTPIAVKGALVFNNMLKTNGLTKRYEAIQNGEKVKFAYMKMPNPSQATVITCSSKLPAELGLDKYVDKEMQFEKTFLQPITNIVDKIGWSAEEKTTLESFFG